MTNLEKKLTPAAKKIYKQAVDDYKKKLLILAHKSAALNTGNVEEISVQDVLKNLQKNDSSRIRFIKIMQTYTVILITLFLTILSFSITDLFPESFFLDNFSLFTLLTILALLALISVNFVYKNPLFFLNKNSDEVFTDTGYVLKIWQEFEALLRKKYSKKYGKSANNYPLSLLIERLYKDDSLSYADREGIINAMKTRNLIVHENTKLDTNVYRNFYNQILILKKKI